MFIKLSAAQAITVINSERDYQIRKWGEEDAGSSARTHSVGDWLVILFDYVDETLSHSFYGTDMTAALNTLRKVAAIATVALEQHRFNGSREQVYLMYTDNRDQLGSDDVDTEDFYATITTMHGILKAAFHKFSRQSGDHGALDGLERLGIDAFWAVMRYGPHIRGKNDVIKPPMP
jgi:hypothetical protein